MSEEIIFSDMLNHYSLKLSEINDMLKNTADYLNKSVIVANESWSSQSANAFNEKIAHAQQYIKKVDISLDELMSLLNIVKSNLIENIDI